MFLNSSSVGMYHHPMMGAIAGGFLAFVLGMLVFFLLIAILCYVYLSIVFMSIARRGKSRFSPGIAWIPGVGPALIASDIAKMHWWPVLLLVGICLPGLGFLFVIAFAVFMVIWMWKTFEKLHRPGWWAILSVIPIVNIVYLVLLGVAAWGSN